jgi:purine-binding chemotaxis protein CheW
MKVMTMETDRQKQAGSDAPESQFVTFEIGDHTFLIPIERVVEFRTWSEPTSVPHTPSYVRGIVNIRGEIVPVYDVAARLGRGLTEPGARHVVVIVRGEESRSVGLLVDSVTDIVNARPDNMAPMPKIEGGDATPFMSGVVFAEERILGVTDVDRLVSETFPDGVEMPAAQAGPAA